MTEIEVGNDEHYGHCVLISYLKSREDAFEKKKELESALKLKELMKARIKVESVKQVGSCDQHECDVCSDCEKWFLLQSLMEDSEK